MTDARAAAKPRRVIGSPESGDTAPSLRVFASPREPHSVNQDKENSHKAHSVGQVKENSREAAKARSNVEELSAIIVDCAYKLHVEVGPGLLESVYEVVLAKMLEERGLSVKRQVPVPIHLMGMKFDEGFRADILVENVLLIEPKSVEHLAPVHSKQVLTYLRLLNRLLGLLINFGAATFKDGCKRIVNNHTALASSRLRVNQQERTL